MDTALKDRIREKCRTLDIPLVGFAGTCRWEKPLFEPWVPPEFQPASIFPETKSVIVIGLPVSLPVLETTPSIWYHEHYRTVNTLLDQYAYRIALVLTKWGFPSVSIPRDAYGSIAVLRKNPVAFFSHRHAAFLAGLGNFGTNNVLLTPEYGPRVRFASIFTAADIPQDPLCSDDLCIRCMQCVECCPVQALTEGTYPESLTDKSACSARSEELASRYISPCGLCIRVCPVGEDRVQFSRENTRRYQEGRPEFERDHRAWSHVQKYGGL